MAKQDLVVPVAYRYYRLKPRKKMKPLGLCSFDKKTIYINKCLTEKGQWSNAFWHEWLHAVAHEGGYTKVSDNEAFIEYVAGALMRMVADPVGGEMLKRMIKNLAPE